MLALASHLGPRLVKRGRGGVVFMGSLLAFHGTPLAANYAAIKAYVQTLEEGLQVKWAPHGHHQVMKGMTAHQDRTTGRRSG